MEQPKYNSQKPSIPAVEASPRPLEAVIETSPPQKKPNPLAPIELEDDENENEDDGNAIKVDQNGLRVLEDEGGNGEATKVVAEPPLPAAPPTQK
jgi:hypothetical protein